MNLLAIDPGNSTGWAVFRQSLLESCGLITPKAYGTLFPPFNGLVIIEEPTIYPHSKADPANIMQLQLKVGELRGRLMAQGATVELVQPPEWKGNVPKEIMWGRSLRKLSLGELTRVPKNARHDTWDAIGLGLWRLKR